MTHETVRQYVRQMIMRRDPDKAWMADNMLFLHLAGSRLYGTNTEESDWDVRGVTLAPKSYWVGGNIGKRDLFEAKDESLGLDIVIYDFRKWLNLAINVNPNVIETLFVTPETNCILEESPNWAWIRSRIMPLINRRAHPSYRGYAHGQLKQMVIKQNNKTGRRNIVWTHGFDTKFAMHGFRLARQGVELLSTGKLVFPRPDAKNLIKIRNGMFPSAEACIEAWKLEDAKLDEAVANSPLPAEADFATYDGILQDVYDRLVNLPYMMKSQIAAGMRECQVCHSRVCSVDRNGDYVCEVCTQLGDPHA